MMSLSIYSVDLELLDDLIIKVEQNALGNENLSVNLVFSRLLRSIEISPGTFVRRLRRRRQLNLTEAIAIYNRIYRLFLGVYDKTNDLRYLNCLLKLQDNWRRNYGIIGQLYSMISDNGLSDAALRKSLNDRFLEVEGRDLKQEVKVTNRFLDDAQIESFILDENIKNIDESVVIFCPNVRSLYTLCVAEILRMKGVKVKAIVVKPIFSISRISDEVTRDGIKWVLKKFVQRFLFRNYSNRIVSARSLSHLARRIHVAQHDVASWARLNNAEIMYTNNFNSSEIETFLKGLSVELGVFTGGGLIRKNILNIFSQGIVNCHGGLLPAYRGLDVEKWPIVENQALTLGCCAHLMSEGVDEGPILIQYRSDSLSAKSIERLGFNLEYPQCTVISYAVLKYLDGSLEPIYQVASEGRQFYYMHHSLVNIVRKKLLGQNYYKGS